MSDSDDDQLRHELLANAATMAAEQLAEIAAERSQTLHRLGEEDLTLAFNNALATAGKLTVPGMHIRPEHKSSPPGFPSQRFDALCFSDPDRPAAVISYKWLGDASDVAACVFDLLSLGATAQAGLVPAAHLVLVVPHEGTPGGHARLIATLTELFSVFVTKAELESFAGDWWLRRHQAGDSGYESATPPQVPEALELRPKIVRPIRHAQNDQPWTLYCVQVRPVAARVIEARARYCAQMEKKQQLEAKLLANAKARLSDIETLLAAFERAEEDAVYRYYHYSAKVFGQQAMIRRARQLLSDLAPTEQDLKHMFESVCRDALDHEFQMSRTNANWKAETRPILEAFWHCKYFLEQLNHYAREIDEPANLLPTGWAAVLELYGLR